MKLEFTKMHGCGNDYLYVDCLAGGLAEAAAAVRAGAGALCDRHTGVGADGVILIGPSHTANARMYMYNRDGSEGAMCGNGVRCVAEYLFRRARAPGGALDIETAAGIRRVTRVRPGLLTVSMGPPVLDAARIPVRGFSGPVTGALAEVRGGAVRITCVSMGNAHCVVFVPDVPAMDVPRRGADFQASRPFPDGVNVEFAQQTGPASLLTRVYERGAGETLACGTGACAAAVAAVLLGKCQRGDDIAVTMPGGVLTVRWTQSDVLLTGAAAEVFTGNVEV